MGTHVPQCANDTSLHVVVLSKQGRAAEALGLQVLPENGVAPRFQKGTSPPVDAGSVSPRVVVLP